MARYPVACDLRERRKYDMRARPRASFVAKTESSKDTIQLKLYFWTNNLPLDQIKKDHSSWDPKRTAWNSGVIGLVSDKRRGIRAAQVPFNGPDDFRNKLNG